METTHSAILVELQNVSLMYKELVGQYVQCAAQLSNIQSAEVTLYKDLVHQLNAHISVSSEYFEFFTHCNSFIIQELGVPIQDPEFILLEAFQLKQRLQELILGNETLLDDIKIKNERI